ncbi:Fungal specific transcription factor [Metarhizium rileyi]|uniref:Fungal specific transcription factor n=1 Tax=Metarhizium rileyi (strain RCEF 4871) TaxID=1649241 RepID=A0A5C6GL62_METRR|nr:Fungal specific transcription factor [Metarhizium rileyi]
MVFAIGCSHGLINEQGEMITIEGKAKSKTSPEEYYTRACVHFDNCVRPGSGSLEALQALLLLASYSLLRPVLPGACQRHIIGMAMRIAVDLGLHCEDNTPDCGVSGNAQHFQSGCASNGENSRKEQKAWTDRELGRRSWWCTCSLDRLVSISAGRPFSISDHDITTPLPSLQEEEMDAESDLITPVKLPGRQQGYQDIAHHFIKLRLLQSDILRHYAES